MAIAVVTGLGQTACSVFTPVPLLELTKATGVAASSLISVGPSTARDTVYHLHPAFHSLCIEFNPHSQSADILPALQAELRDRQIESRIYEYGAATNICDVWLHYEAYIQWDIAPFTNDYKTFLTTASLTLRDANRKVLSHSAYNLDPVYGMGKWSSIRSKIAPMVTALVTGFEK